MKESNRLILSNTRAPRGLSPKENDAQIDTIIEELPESTWTLGGIALSIAVGGALLIGLFFSCNGICRATTLPTNSVFSKMGLPMIIIGSLLLARAIYNFSKQR
jgi:hypothetical protein